MKISGLRLSVLATALCAVSGVAQAQGAAVSHEVADEARNSYICVFNDAVPRAEVPTAASSIAREHAAGLRFVYQDAIKGFSVNVPEKAVANMAKNPAIKYCEQNAVATILGSPVAAGEVRQKGAPIGAAAVQQIPYGVTRVGGPVAGVGKHAWIIDTGIDLDNPDLNVGAGVNFVRGKNTADDLNGHGTHVAGTVAAIDNAIDVVGVAAGATVHPVRVLDANGSGTIDGVIAGINFVAANAQPGDVANMSLGASGHIQSLHDAVLNTANKGILFAVAAGNESDYAGNHEPAHVEHPNVYTVSAVDSADLFASFSNYGNPPIDFAAPGVGVVSNRVGGGVVAYSGTSMATPHVAGLLLLLGGTPNVSGMAWGDPDGVADPIAHY